MKIYNISREHSILKYGIVVWSVNFSERGYRTRPLAGNKKGAEQQYV